MRAIKRTLCTALVCALLLAAVAPVSALAFTDTQGSWAEEIIDQAKDYGLITGYPDGSFGVGREISRAEFVTILCRMFAWEEVRPDQPSFSDVPAGHWAYPYIETALAHDVMDPGGAFRPEAYISRAEMAVMLVRALGYDALAQSLSGATLPFDDVTEDRGYIAIAYDIGMITGIETNGVLSFKPAFSARREEAAAMLVRVYERYTSQVDWLHGFYAFSSYSQIDLTAQMDAVSLGWARLEYDSAAGARINSTTANGNEWVIPSQPELATDYFDAHGTAYNLNIYADCTGSVTLADGTTTSVVEAVLADGDSRRQAAAAIAAAAEGYAGVTIDFEGLKGETVRAAYPLFLSALREALSPEQTLYVCVQPDTWYTGYDYRAIGEACDRVILMAHDYQWTSIPADYVGTANTDSPVTPFPDIYEALRDITDPDTGVQDRSKIALAISFGTAGFHVDEAGRLLDTTIYHPAQDTLAARLAQSDTTVTYFEDYRNPCASYTTEDGEHYLVWYEDARSVADKIQLAKLFGVTGVSLWRIGNIPTYDHYDVWSAVLAQ